MDKDKFIMLLSAMVDGFESAGFQERLMRAKDSSDLPTMMGLPLAVQNYVFSQAGLEPQEALGRFTKAGETFADDEAVGPLMQRMQKALQGN